MPSGYRMWALMSAGMLSIETKMPGKIRAQVRIKGSLGALTYAVMRSRLFTQRVLILGATPLALKIIIEIKAQPHLGYDIVGVADDFGAPGSDAVQFPISIRGPLEHLGKIVDEIHPHRIIVALSERRGRLLEHPAPASRSSAQQQARRQRPSRGFGVCL